jgi:hypothetical protein
VITVPLDGIAPIIIAAVANPEKRGATDQWNTLQTILGYLYSQKIRVVSYASDGANVERKVQSLMMEAEPLFCVYQIPTPEGLPAVQVKIGSSNGNPFVPVQDAKHFAKTARNNHFSGATTLVLGNYIVCYEDMRPLGGFGSPCADYPCYASDVDGLDRQDDAAALRYLSSATIEWTKTHFPNLRGFIIYLFIFGELVDAWQSRHIKHIDRVIMALRAWYFLQFWIEYLNHVELPLSRHCISHEAIDIMKTLIHSLIGLIIIYRDHLPEEMHLPLLPWHHSTEVCEHFFGLMRQKMKDFSYRDFLYMVNPLHRLLRASMHRKTDTKVRSSGYSHSWADNTGLDNEDLAIFPTDGEIAEAACAAFAEAEELFETLGVHVSVLKETLRQSNTTTPVFSSQFTAEGPVCY